MKSPHLDWLGYPKKAKRRDALSLVLLAMALSALAGAFFWFRCVPSVAASTAFPDPSGDYRPSGATGGASLYDVQSFQGGAGAYVWAKPAGAKFIAVGVMPGGSGGGSGGAGTSDGGGGGAAGATIAFALFPAASVGDSETITLGAGGMGGTGVTGNVNGNAGVTGEESSFGTLLRARLSLTVAAGGGGVNGVSSAGATNLNAGSVVIGIRGYVDPANGGNGRDTTAGSAGTGKDSGYNPLYETPIIVAIAGAGGGGGGTNTGANFTAGGQSGRACASSGCSIIFIASSLGGVGDAGAGGNGTNGTFVSTTYAPDGTHSATVHAVSGGSGGGGSGSVLGNGGNGGNGGNCGGAGGGGGASLAAFTSGGGGNGGAGCAIVLSY